MTDYFIFDDTFDDDNTDPLPTGNDRFPLVENDKGGYSALSDWMEDEDNYEED